MHRVRAQVSAPLAAIGTNGVNHAGQKRLCERIGRGREWRQAVSERSGTARLLVDGTFARNIDA